MVPEANIPEAADKPAPATAMMLLLCLRASRNAVTLVDGAMGNVKRCLLLVFKRPSPNEQYCNMRSGGQEQDYLMLRTLRFAMIAK